jgi:hypothetical protein
MSSKFLGQGRRPEEERYVVAREKKCREIPSWYHVFARGWPVVKVTENAMYMLGWRGEYPQLVGWLNPIKKISIYYPMCN